MAEGEPDDLSRETDRWVANLSRHQPRRSWMVPLLAVPIGQVVTERNVPRSFFVYGEDVLNAARELGQAVLAIAERVTTDPEAQLTDDEAADVLELVLAHRAVLLQVLSSPSMVAELLSLPAGLAGDGLVRRLAKAIAERPEPPGRLAVLAASLLVELVDVARDRDYVPLPHSSFLAISRSLDLRCYQLGLRSWADGLRHAAAIWTAETWHGLLLGFAGSN